MRVIFAREQSVHDLPDDEQGRIAGVVINVFETHVNRVTVIVGQYLHMEATRIKGRFQKPEMDRGHLRAEDRVLVAHFLCENKALELGGYDLTRLSAGFLELALPYTDGSKQGTHTDPGCSEVIYLIDFQTGVYLPALRENFLYLICCDRIQSAAERVQLDDIQILGCFNIIGSRIQSGVVHPLIVHTDRTLELSEMGYRIL